MLARLLPFVALAALLLNPRPSQAENPRRPPRVFLGIAAQRSSGERPGIVVADVDPGSPAARAGLRQGDEIVRVGDQEIKSYDALVNALAKHKPGEKVTLGVLRDGKEQDLSVTLAERPTSPSEGSRAEGPATRPFRGERGGAFLGVEAAALSRQEKDRMGVSAEAGAVVREVMPHTPADHAGIRSGDVITKVDDRPIRGPEDLREAVRLAGAGKEVAVTLARGAETKTVHAKLETSPAGEEFMPPAPWTGGPATQRLERRINELERRVRELEQKLNQRTPPPK